MSIVLLADILEQDPDDVRQRAGPGQCFVHMSWSFGGGVARFETRLILADEAGYYLRFTHGLEHERGLDGYMKSLLKLQTFHQPAIDTGTHGARDDTRSSTRTRVHDRGSLETVDQSAPTAIVDKEIHDDEAMEENYTQGSETDAPRYSQHDERPRTCPALSGPFDLGYRDRATEEYDQSEATSYRLGGQGQPEYRRYSLVDETFQYENGSCQPEDGSRQSEDGFSGREDGPDTPDDESLDREVDKQLFDELLSRDMISAESRVCSPRDVGTCGNIWKWRRDVMRWC